MTSRERVQVALNHQEPDRVPLDLGGGVTSLLVDTYENLKTYLDVKDKTRLGSRVWQYVFVDEPVLERLGIDTRYVVEKGPKYPKDKEISGDTFVDEWGVVRKKIGYYYDIIEHPLKEAQIEDLEKYPWPDPLDPGRTEGILEEAENLHQRTDYAIIGRCSASIFEQSWYLRGYDQFLIDLITDKEFAHKLLRKLTDIKKIRMKNFLEKVGRYIDVIGVGDDLAIDRGPAISPALYREMVKPYQWELFNLAHSLTKAKLFYHSCGNVYALIEDLIEVGVDILNPVQVSAGDMGDTARLKKQFGEHLCFWGAIDTQKVMPFGSVDEVRREVIRRIRDLAPEGGYVLAAVHNMCPDIPPENICAMFEAGKKYGHYPIS
jgi:uroporphyrinogen decarboxylase